MALQNESPAMSEKLHLDYDYTVAEVVWAVRYEMAEQLTMYYREGFVYYS